MEDSEHVENLNFVSVSKFVSVSWIEISPDLGFNLFGLNLVLA